MSRRINIHESVEATIPKQALLNLQESAKSSKTLPDKITTVVEAIHSGLTRNSTFYPADNLQKSVDSWTSPYNKPVIKNHNVHEEPLGRVKSAHFKQSNLAPDKQTIELELEITDKATIEKVLDGRYQTLSIGGNTSSAICNICGKDLVKEGYCGHMKGRTYEGKQAHWIIGEMSFDEISWVNVPADSNAQVVHKNTTLQTEAASTEAEGGMNSMQDDKQATDILEQIDGLVGIAPIADEAPATSTEPAGAQAEAGTTPEGDETPEGAASTQAEGDTTPEGDEDPTLQEQLDEAKNQIATLQAENVILVADKEALTEEVDTLTAEKVILTDKVTALEADLAVADAENKSAVKQSTTLATYTHTVLSESVAIVQVALGKVEESDLESTKVALSKQTSRSLKEQLTALAKEKPAARIVQTVAHPSTTGGSEGDIAESTTQEKKELTLNDYADTITKAMNKQFN
jgi:hypothetical protein